MSDMDMGYDALQEASQEAYKRRCDPVKAPTVDIEAAAKALWEVYWSANPPAPRWEDTRSGSRAIWLQKARTVLSAAGVLPDTEPDEVGMVEGTQDTGGDHD